MRPDSHGATDSRVGAPGASTPVERPPRRRGVNQSDDELFAAMYQPLRRFAANVGSSDIEPDDLVQEALVRVLARGPLSGLDDPAAYLRRTIVNLASNERRSKARWRKALSRLNPQATTDAVYPSDLSELDRLSGLDRAVLHLSHVDGFSSSEIGRQLSLTENAVNLRISRARKRLREDLERQAIAEREERGEELSTRRSDRE